MKLKNLAALSRVTSLIIPMMWGVFCGLLFDDWRVAIPLAVIGGAVWALLAEPRFMRFFVKVC